MSALVEVAEIVAGANGDDNGTVLIKRKIGIKMIEYHI